MFHNHSHLRVIFTVVGRLHRTRAGTVDMAYLRKMEEVAEEKKKDRAKAVGLTKSIITSVFFLKGLGLV